MKYHDTGAEILAAILILVIALILALIGAWIGVWLWGLIMVNIFGLPALTFWQFYGLMILLHILLPGRGVQRKKED